MGGGGGEEDGQGAASSHAQPGAGPRSAAQGRHQGSASENILLVLIETSTVNSNFEIKVS